jgi:hypothetical protein
LHHMSTVAGGEIRLNCACETDRHSISPFAPG